MTIIAEPANDTAPRPGVLQQRDFRLLWIGETTSKFGSAITGIALPLVAVTVLDASALAMGVLTAFAWLPWLLFGLPAGAWVDRWPRRTVMIVCDTGRADFTAQPYARRRPRAERVRR